MGPVAILVPVLRRPHRVAPLLDSIEANTPAPHRVLFICTTDDHEEKHAISVAGGEYITLLGAWGHGDYMQKVNLAVRITSDPLIFLGADDLKFHPEWLEYAVEQLSDTVQVVGTNDRGNRRVMRGEHATHSLLTREYAQRGTIDEPDKVLHEGYSHNFCDDEFVQTAKSRGAFAFAARSIVEHLHPNWAKAEDDDTYRLGQQGFARDRRLFERRQPLWS